MTTAARHTPPSAVAARRALGERLRLDLHFAQGRYAHIANLEELRDLHARIRSTASELRPDSPDAAIRAAQRELKLDDLAIRLSRRAQLPAETAYAAEGVRVQARWQETRILDLARQLEPQDPRLAIDLAQRSVLEKSVGQGEVALRPPGPALEAFSRRLSETTRQMKRLTTFPQPTPQGRVHRILRDLRRLDDLDLEYRNASESRRHLVYRGSVTEIRSTLERVPVPREELEKSVAEIYRNPDSALEAIRKSVPHQGLDATIDRFKKDPAAFGKLRGIHVPGLGNSPQRARALDLVWHSSGYASTALARRERLESELVTAVSYQRLQNENREVVASYPGREKLLVELGRHMEGLELHEVRPLLQPGQAKLVQDVRRAEQYFLEPLREGAGKLLSLEARGVALTQSAVQAKAQEVAALFRYAPRYILKRLTPPQVQGALLAVAVVKRAVKAVTRGARV